MEAALGGRDPASITKVRLSNKSYSPEAAGVIGEALKKMTSVIEVICPSFIIIGCVNFVKIRTSLLTLD